MAPTTVERYGVRGSKKRTMARGKGDKGQKN